MTKYLWLIRLWLEAALRNRRDDPTESLFWHLGYARFEQAGCFYTGEPTPLSAVVFFRLAALTTIIKERITQ